MDCSTELDYWTVVLKWTIGLLYWTGLLECSTELDYWTVGLLAEVDSYALFSSVSDWIEKAEGQEESIGAGIHRICASWLQLLAGGPLGGTLDTLGVASASREGAQSHWE